MNSLRNLKIGARLALGFGVVLVLAMVITAVGMWKLRVVANATREMMDLPVAKERMASDWARYVSIGVMRTTAIAKSADPSLSQFFAKDAAASTQAAERTRRTREVAPVLRLGVEAYHQTADTRGGRANTSVGFGGTYDISENYHLLGYVNTGVQNRAATNRASMRAARVVCAG